MTQKSYHSEQEQFWAGEFGSEYIERNQSAELLASNLSFFSKAFKHCNMINSCVEFGANIGMNLRAISMLYPNISLYGAEINPNATSILKEFINPENVYQGSILDDEFAIKADLVLIKGVLIHINPNLLMDTYHKLYKTSTKYIVIAEYYNPTPVSITYRGHTDRLFKRDFAGEMMALYPDLKLIDYGFVYKNDPDFPQDDITWFVLRKEV